MTYRQGNRTDGGNETTIELVSRERRRTGKTAQHADLSVFFRSSFQHSPLRNLKELCRRNDAAINF